MSDLLAYGAIKQITDDAFENWDSYNRETRRFQALKVIDQLSRCHHPGINAQATSYLQKHQRLWAEVLRWK